MYDAKRRRKEEPVQPLSDTAILKVQDRKVPSLLDELD